MTITEKKPLLIRIPGEITPNELPVSASAVGYDFVQGNYLVYATGSDSWVTAPPNTAGIKEYWQSDINNEIFTTGSIVVSGSVILGDAASDVVYISGSVTASNGLLVNGNLNVNGGVITYGGTTADGVTVGQVFEDTDTTGGSYGLVIKNAGTSFGKPFLAFVQGSTIGTGYAGGISGWTKAPADGYIQGVNIATPASYPNVGFNINGSNIARFNAGGLQVTGSVNVSNGVKVADGGLQVAGNIIDGGFKGPIFVDDTLSDGSSYGVVIRNQSASGYAAANISLVQNSTYIGTIGGLNNTPAGTTFGLLGGVNIAALNNKVINFRAYDPGTPANSYSFGKFSSTGLDVTGVVTASLGFSGSLTRLTDGTPYLLAGPNITLTTGSKGQIAISGSASSATGKQQLSAKEIVNSTSPIMTSQFAWIPSDYTGLSFVGVRAIMATDGTANLTGSLQIYNLTSGSYVDLIDTPTVSSYFTVTSSAPTFITSSNLISGITNFDNTSNSIYEVRVSGSTTNNIVVGYVELIFR